MTKLKWIHDLKNFASEGRIMPFMHGQSHVNDTLLEATYYTVHSRNSGLLRQLENVHYYERSTITRETW